MRNFLPKKDLNSILFLFVLAFFLFVTNNYNAFANKKIKAFTTILLPNVISSNTILTANNSYLINGKVFLTNNAILTIEPGTKIFGIYKSVPSQASVLIITKGCKINAIGTKENPIVFSARIDATNPTLSSGDWGGIFILGKARTNQPLTSIISGIDLATLPNGVTAADLTFGGNDNNDNSGTINYVRVEYAGAFVGNGIDQNSLTFAGVGSRTIVNHIQSYRSGGDSFSFLGGNVSARYLVSTTAFDDAFDFSFGYTGKLQFLVAITNPNSPYGFQPNCIEIDNDLSGTNAFPITRPVISNLTNVGTANGASIIIGSGVLTSAIVRRNADLVLCNSIIYGYRKAIVIETPQPIIIENNVIGYLPATTSIAPFPAFPIGVASNIALSASNNIVETYAFGLKIANPFQFSGFCNSGFRSLRPIAAPSSIGATFVDDLSDSFFIPTNFKGAIPPNNFPEFYWLGDKWLNKFNVF